MLLPDHTQCNLVDDEKHFSSTIKKRKYHHHHDNEPTRMFKLPSDMIFHILQYCDSMFYLRVGVLVSHEWKHLILTRLELDITLESTMSFEKLISCTCNFNDNIYNNLTMLTIINLDIGSEGAKLLTSTSSSLNQQLRHLDICGNNIGPKGATFISRMKTLTSLDIGFNDIGDEGAKSISSCMNQQLTDLHINNNMIGDEGVKSITSSMNLLQSLDIGCNNFGLKGLESFACYCSNSSMNQLKSLNLRYNSIDDKGVKLITNSTFLQQLTALSMIGNRIGDEGAKSISSNMKQLIYLDLHKNKISVEGCKLINSSMKQLKYVRF